MTEKIEIDVFKKSLNLPHTLKNEVVDIENTTDRDYNEIWEKLNFKVIKSNLYETKSLILDFKIML